MFTAELNISFNDQWSANIYGKISKVSLGPKPETQKYSLRLHYQNITASKAKSLCKNVTESIGLYGIYTGFKKNVKNHPKTFKNMEKTHTRG